ncbi:glycoside hydrolase family 140 protein, partial [bacterium]|nr:glycoside hydrolase family 140 protein [bacterium]
VIPRSGGQCFDTAEQAYAFGHFLGVRFRDHGNIVWILGGDRHPDERPEGLALWRAMAEGIADGTNGEDSLNSRADYSTTCMTHHAFGSSSLWFHEDPWIDFHMWGSYHSDFSLSRAWEQAGSDWALPRPKPTLNAEPAYENHPVNWIRDNGKFTSYDSRQIAYWSVFSGACGHTYGCHEVWQFYAPGRMPVTFADRSWQEALLLPGAGQMIFLRRLMESRPQFGRVPDQALIAGGTGPGSGHAAALRGRGFAFFYLPAGYPIVVRTELLEWKKIKAWWYDPRNGESVLIGIYGNTGPLTFQPLGVSKELEWLRTGRGCDWVLVLDDFETGCGAPGHGCADQD